MVDLKTNPIDLDEIWQFGIVAKVLHWIIALLIIGLLTLGWYMMSLEDKPGSGWYFDLHKSFGLIAFTLILFRIIWRLFHKPEALPSYVPRWEKKSALVVEWLLYSFMLLMPLAGFLGASLNKYGVAFFGLQLPRWLPVNHHISEIFFSLHGFIAWILVVLISLHILAAFKHLLINRNKVFNRMWF